MALKTARFLRAGSTYFVAADNWSDSEFNWIELGLFNPKQAELITALALTNEQDTILRNCKERIETLFSEMEQAVSPLSIHTLERTAFTVYGSILQQINNFKTRLESFERHQKANLNQKQSTYKALLGGILGWFRRIFSVKYSAIHKLHASAAQSKTPHTTTLANLQEGAKKAHQQLKQHIQNVFEKKKWPSFSFLRQCVQECQNNASLLPDPAKPDPMYIEAKHFLENQKEMQRLETDLFNFYREPPSRDKHIELDRILGKFEELYPRLAKLKNIELDHDALEERLTPLQKLLEEPNADIAPNTIDNMLEKIENYLKKIGEQLNCAYFLEVDPESVDRILQKHKKHTNFCWQELPEPLRFAKIKSVFNAFCVRISDQINLLYEPAERTQKRDNQNNVIKDVFASWSGPKDNGDELAVRIKWLGFTEDTLADLKNHLLQFEQLTKKVADAGDDLDVLLKSLSALKNLFQQSADVGIFVSAMIQDSIRKLPLSAVLVAYVKSSQDNSFCNQIISRLKIAEAHAPLLRKALSQLKSPEGVPAIPSLFLLMHQHQDLKALIPVLFEKPEIKLDLIQYCLKPDSTSKEMKLQGELKKILATDVPFSFDVHSVSYVLPAAMITCADVTAVLRSSLKAQIEPQKYDLLPKRYYPRLPHTEDQETVDRHFKELEAYSKNLKNAIAQHKALLSSLCLSSINQRLDCFEQYLKHFRSLSGVVVNRTGMFSPHHKNAESPRSQVSLAM